MKTNVHKLLNYKKKKLKIEIFHFPLHVWNENKKMKSSPPCSSFCPTYILANSKFKQFDETIETITSYIHINSLKIWK
jgi:hypothetical protein